MTVIDGKAIAAEIEKEIKQQVDTFTNRQPCLAVIIVGDDPASAIYVRRKTQACERVGITSKQQILSASTTQEELLRHITALNNDDQVDGILVQLPLPEQIDPNGVIDAIDPNKDVDGFHPVNVGKLLIGRRDEALLSCTPYGVYVLLQKLQIDPTGKHVVIVGRSNIVGKPMAAILMQRWEGANATVTVVHSKSKDLVEQCRRADILVAAVGKASFITADMVKEGAVVIDVGINRVDDATVKKGYRIAGDVDFEGVKNKCSAITPVPGGVGPLTIAMLLQNTVTAHRRLQQALSVNTSV